jgi:hypothetical protein
MTAAQIVNAVLFAAWPILIGIAFWLFHFLIGRLPMHTRLAHAQFARMAVEKVEQKNPDMQEQAKKSLALIEIVKICDDYGLPAPRQSALDAHIESAFYNLKPRQ